MDNKPNPDFIDSVKKIPTRNNLAQFIFQALGFTAVGGFIYYSFDKAKKKFTTCAPLQKFCYEKTNFDKQKLDEYIKICNENKNNNDSELCQLDELDKYFGKQGIIASYNSCIIQNQRNVDCKNYQFENFNENPLRKKIASSNENQEDNQNIEQQQ